MSSPINAATVGDLRINTVTNDIETYTGSTWVGGIASDTPEPSSITLGNTTFTEAELIALKELLLEKYPEIYV